MYVDSLDNNPIKFPEHLNNSSNFSSIIPRPNLHNVSLHNSPSLDGLLDSFAWIFIGQMMGPLSFIEVSPQAIEYSEQHLISLNYN